MLRKILIVRFSSIGDLVLITPVIRCVKKQIPSEIHLLVKKKFYEVLAANPYLHKTWTIEKSCSEIIEELKKENFDLIIDLQYNFRSIWLTWQLKVAFIRFNKLNIEKWLMTQWKIDRLPGKHLVDRYFDALASLGIQNDGRGLDFFIDENSKKSIGEFSLPSEYVVGVLGATYTTKQIPLNKWHEIVYAVDLPIVLIGGMSEQTMAAELNRQYPHKVLDYSGRLSLHQSAAVIQAARMIITPDTGMMHIAASFNKSMHVIWGNTIPQFGMYPYVLPGNLRIRNHEVSGLSCRPCSKLGYSACPKKHFDCMQKHLFDKTTMEL